MRTTEVYDERGHLLLSTIGIETDTWDTLYSSWHVAIVFERVVRTNDTGRLEWNNLVAIVERGNPTRYFR